MAGHEHHRHQSGDLFVSGEAAVIKPMRREGGEQALGHHGADRVLIGSEGCGGDSIAPFAHLLHGVGAEVRPVLRHAIGIGHPESQPLSPVLELRAVLEGQPEQARERRDGQR